jgi:hypothetical protein
VRSDSKNEKSRRNVKNEKSDEGNEKSSGGMRGVMEMSGTWGGIRVAVQ